MLIFSNTGFLIFLSDLLPLPELELALPELELVLPELELPEAFLYAFNL